MTTPPDLLELASRVEAATGPDRALDKAILAALGYTWRGMDYWHGDDIRTWKGGSFFTASLDSAMTLVPEDAFWRLGHDGEGADPSLFKATVGVVKEGGAWHGFRSAIAATPALALTAASLRAIKQEAGDDRS